MIILNSFIDSANIIHGNKPLPFWREFTFFTYNGLQRECFHLQKHN